MGFMTLSSRARLDFVLPLICFVVIAIYGDQRGDVAVVDSFFLSASFLNSSNTVCSCSPVR
jgi:hypothetical protein